MHISRHVRPPNPTKIPTASGNGSRLRQTSLTLGTAFPVEPDTSSSAGRRNIVSKHSKQSTRAVLFAQEFTRALETSPIARAFIIVPFERQHRETEIVISKERGKPSTLRKGRERNFLTSVSSLEAAAAAVGGKKFCSSSSDRSGEGAHHFVIYPFAPRVTFAGAFRGLGGADVPIDTE